MLIYCILLLVALLPVVLFPNRWGLASSLSVVCLISGIRYGQGDYYNYLKIFEAITQGSFLDYFELASSWKEFVISKHHVYNVELFYFVVQKLFEPLGFEFFIFCATVFFVTACYCFINEFVNPKYYWLALLILYNPILLISFLSATRQGIACAFFALSLVCLSQNVPKWKIAILLMLGIGFHSSCIIFLPLLFVQKIDFYKIFPVILIFLLCSPLLTYVVMAAAKFVSQGHYLEDGRSNSVIYTLALSGMILGGICVTRIKDDKTSLIATLVLGLVFTRFFASLEPALFYLNRVGMYFEFCTVAFFPMVLEHKKSFLSNIGIFFVVIFLFIRAYVFFLAPWTGDDKFHYTTVFTKDSYE